MILSVWYVTFNSIQNGRTVYFRERCPLRAISLLSYILHTEGVFLKDCAVIILLKTGKIYRKLINLEYNVMMTPLGKAMGNSFLRLIWRKQWHIQSDNREMKVKSQRDMGNMDELSPCMSVKKPQS